MESCFLYDIHVPSVQILLSGKTIMSNAHMLSFYYAYVHDYNIYLDILGILFTNHGPIMGRVITIHLMINIHNNAHDRQQHEQ